MKRILSVLVCAVMLLAFLPQSASAAGLSNVNIRLNDPVASYSPDYSAEPSDSAVYVWSVTWKENSPGFSATLNSKSEFRAGLAYKVEILLGVLAGNYYDTDIYGQLAACFTVNGKPAAKAEAQRWEGGKITQVLVTYEYDPLPGMVISNVLVKGIPTPVAGDMPIYSFTLGNSNTYQFYHTEPVVWWDLTNDRQMTSSDIFIKGHKYQLNIWLRANREGGFTFKTDSRGDPQVNVTLNSWAADSVTKAYEQEGREVIDIRYTFPACQAAHTCAPKLVPQQDPTCLLSGFRAYYECSCGKCFEDAAGKKEITDMDGYGILPANGHKEGGWSYNGTHHYKKCTTCMEVISGTNAAHSGGKATCVEKGKCTVCDYAYLPENEDHIPEDKWTACADLYHAHLCKLCGAHCDPEAHTDTLSCLVCGYLNDFFSDVKKTDYFYNAVVWAVKEGITTGTSDTTFSPEMTCTRGQVVTFLWRAAGCPAPKTGNSPFIDVAQSDYYYDAVIWAVEEGITKGTSSTTFSPGENCTRGQVVTFLWRSQGSPAPGTANPFVDVQANDYYYHAVLWAVEKGITNGTSATDFSPAAQCTRGQVVTFLYRCAGQP